MQYPIVNLRGCFTIINLIYLQGTVGHSPLGREGSVVWIPYPYPPTILHQPVSLEWKSQWAGQTEFPDLFWQNWLQMVGGMNNAGIPLMVGTDLMCPGILPGYSVHEEIAIWQEAGIPAADVLRSATLVPAQFMGLGERLGSVCEGKPASMVLVGANPLEDIQNAQQIEGVFLQGQYYDRYALDRLLDEAKDLSQHSTL